MKVSMAFYKSVDIGCNHLRELVGADSWITCLEQRDKDLPKPSIPVGFVAKGQNVKFEAVF